MSNAEGDSGHQHACRRPSACRDRRRACPPRCRRPATAGHARRSRPASVPGPRRWPGTAAAGGRATASTTAADRGRPAHPLPLAGKPAGDVGRERRLAAAALGIGDQDRLHRGSLEETRPAMVLRVAARVGGALAAALAPPAPGQGCGLPSTASSAVSAAAPRQRLRAPFQPATGSGRSALSLNGISSVRLIAPNA